MLPITPAIEAKLVSMVATGLSHRDVAKALGISEATVQRYASEAENAQVIAATRSALRRALVVELAADDGPMRILANRLKQEMQAGSAKDMDALSRAFASLERAHANLAGENRKAQAGPRSVTVNVQLPAWLDAPAQADVVEAGSAVSGVLAPHAPEKTDGVPPSRRESIGEDISSRASGLAETDVPVDADFEV